MKNLRRRLVVAAVGIPASIIVVYAGGIFLALGLGFLGAVGYWEYATMMREIGHRPLMGVGVLTAVALPLAVLGLGFPLAWVVAVVALKTGTQATEQEIIGLCRDHLAGYKKPKRVEFVEGLPKNVSGKILKRELRTRFS